MPNRAFSFLPSPLPPRWTRLPSRFLATSSLGLRKTEESPPLSLSLCFRRNVKRHRDRERKKVSSNLGHGEEIIVGMISAVFPAEITTRCGIRFARSSMMINSWNLSVFRWTPLLCPREYNEYKGNPRGFVFDEGSSLSSVPFFVELESYIGLFLWKRWRMDSLFLRDRIWSTC